MSKIGKHKDTERILNKNRGSDLTISGPKEQKLNINDKFFIKTNDTEFYLEPLNKNIDKKTSIMWGTYRSLINNAVTGYQLAMKKY